MRISLTRSGGFAGLTKRYEIDTASLSPDQKRELKERLRRVGGRKPAPSNPDEFQYELEVDGDRRAIDHSAWSDLIRFAVE